MSLGETNSSGAHMNRFLSQEFINTITYSKANLQAIAHGDSALMAPTSTLLNSINALLALISRQYIDSIFWKTGQRSFSWPFKLYLYISLNISSTIHMNLLPDLLIRTWLLPIHSIWLCHSNTLLKPKRHSLRCHGFVVHALLLRMHTNVVDFRVMRRLCHREWNWQWNWQSVNHILGICDNGPRDHGVWRPTLIAYICNCNTFCILSVQNQKGFNAKSLRNKRALMLQTLYSINTLLVLSDTELVALLFSLSQILASIFYNKISSVESQKGVIAAKRCSVENQKGAIAVQSQWQ